MADSYQNNQASEKDVTEFNSIYRDVPDHPDTSNYVVTPANNATNQKEQVKKKKHCDLIVFSRYFAFFFPEQPILNNSFLEMKTLWNLKLIQN